MNRFWIIIRFIIFMPVAALLVSGYALAGALDLSSLAKRAVTQFGAFG
jgi:hypothetical protein